MASDLDIPFNRVTYRDGQRLTAQDLRDDQRHAFRRDGLHTRYLHGTWGIALGFEVTRDDDLSTVNIGPGHAIDELGRDILLAKGVRIAVPDVEGPERFALTLRYREDVAYRDRRDLSAVCLSNGFDLREERPVFSWRRPGEGRFGIEVPLAAIDVRDGEIVRGPDRRVRRTTRPLVRPHIATGETEAGRTGWRYEDDATSSEFGLSVSIDTSAAGFTRPPLYFAQLIGDFSFPSDAGTGSFGAHATLSLGNLAYITRTSQTDFTLRTFPSVTAEEAERRQWRVAWTGIEPVAGCEPGIDWSHLVVLAGWLFRPYG